MARKPNVQRIPVLYAAWWPRGRETMVNMDRKFANGEHEVIAGWAPRSIDHSAAKVAQKDDDPNYWIIKYIPVAIMEPEYKQRRIAGKAGTR